MKVMNFKMILFLIKILIMIITKTNLITTITKTVNFKMKILMKKMEKIIIIIINKMKTMMKIQMKK